jgi:uncharacterized membrane protein
VDHSVIDVRRAIVRVAIALAFGAAGFAAMMANHSVAAAAFVGWDLAGVVLLVLSWSVIVRADAGQTRVRAGGDDPGRSLVYAAVLVTSAVSLLAATILVRNARSVVPDLRDLAVALCLVSVALAWTMTHTAFTFRYAHLYYRDDAEGVGGITMPGDGPPAYYDFAYFAFTIGMCFQVSDMCVTSRQIRRAVLLHATVSFAYNTVILAFVLNLAFGVAA